MVYKTSSRDKLERAAFLAALIARHSTAPLHVIAARVPHLQRIAHQAQRAEEDYCSVPNYPRDDKIQRLQKHADAIGIELGLKVELGGGPCALLYVEGEPGDGYTPNAYAIY